MEAINQFDQDHRFGALIIPSPDRQSAWRIPAGRKQVVDIVKEWNWKVSQSKGNFTLLFIRRSVGRSVRPSVAPSRVFF